MPRTRRPPGPPPADRLVHHMVNGRPVNAAGRFLRAEHAIYPPPPPTFQPFFDQGELTAEEATALNMQRAADLVTKGANSVTVGLNGSGSLIPPRITSGPMPAPPQTIVTHHVAPIVVEPYEPSDQDYAAVLDPEVADELRILGLHPDQLANAGLPPLPPTLEMPNPPLQQPLSPGKDVNLPLTLARGGPPTAATLTYGRTGYRLTKLAGHQKVQSWSFEASAPATLMAEVLAAFGVTVVDLTQEE